MKDKKKPITLSHALYGKVRLEHYREKGFIVSFKGNKEIFWIDWPRMAKIMEKFGEVVKYKQNLKKDNEK